LNEWQFNQPILDKTPSQKKIFGKIGAKALKKAIFWFKLMKNIRFGKRYFERVQYGTTLGTTTPALLADDQTAFS
jgi:hypothetical protein